MKVMKFGGTSVGSVESILTVKRIVESAQEPAIVVVSALGGITDQLLRTGAMAAAGDQGFRESFAAIARRHAGTVEGLLPEGRNRASLLNSLNQLLNELQDIFNGVYLIKDLSTKTSNTIVSYGERLSSLIVSHVIEGAACYDARLFIKTELKHAKNIVDTDLTARLVRETFRELPKAAIVPGFISSDKNTGEVTNLGRGGSDHTAAIIAAALDASILERPPTPKSSPPPTP